MPMASHWNATAATFLALAALLVCDRLAHAAGLCAAPDARIVVDTGAHRLALCDRDKQAATFDVRIGSAGLVNAFDSTSGCVGIATDAEMDRIAAWVNSAGARTIEIR